MTKFETIGVNRQYEADSVREANRCFAHSCNCCCMKNMRIDCDKCSIAYVHNLVVACFNDQKGK